MWFVLLLGAVSAAAPVEPSPGVSNVVFTLVRNDDDLSVFVERSKCLARALAGGPQFDQIVFHEGNLTDDLLRSYVSNARLVDVHDLGAFVLPQHLVESEDIVLQHLIAINNAPLGYRHMVRTHAPAFPNFASPDTSPLVHSSTFHRSPPQCHFMSMIWYRALARYEFAMRVDEDVCLQRFVSNPFEAMRDRSLIYGYGLQTVEQHDETLATMVPWISAFAAAERLTLPAEPVKTMFFTNFFLSRVDWWLRKEVRTHQTHTGVLIRSRFHHQIKPQSCEGSSFSLRSQLGA